MLNKSNYETYWRTIVSENIRTFYYGYSSNIRNHVRLIKEHFDLKPRITIPEGMKQYFPYISTADIEWCPFVPKVLYFRDKQTDVYIFFNMTNLENPVPFLVMTGLQKEQLGDDFVPFLRWSKKNKVI